jgi:hypothetical protein
MANHIMYNFKCCLIVQLNVGLLYIPNSIWGGKTTSFGLVYDTLDFVKKFESKYR